jgi:ParB/RepB/Spo0J family partition protein
MTRTYSAVDLPLRQIYSDDTFNCRGQIQPFEVVDLANDIKKSGLQTPISVQPWTEKPGYKYRILAGHRRFMAFRINESESIPCFIVHVSDELEARDYNLKENLFRQDLNLLQEAKALEPYFKKRLTVKAVSDRLNRSPGWVEPRRQLLELPEDLQQEAGKGTINQQHVKSLYLLRNKPEKMYEVFRNIKEARERGDKVVVVKKDKDLVDITKIRRPAPHELYAVLDVVYNIVTARTGKECFGARCIAFAAGAISELDFWFSLKRECERLEIPFNPPNEIAELLKG